MMAWLWTFSLLLVSLAHVSHQITPPDADSYVGAVVEYSPIFKANDGPQTVLANARAYAIYIKTASAAGADIIVFPECGLTSLGYPSKAYIEPWTTIIPDASENYEPCTEDRIPVSEGLKLMSCAAKENRIYVVINIAEKFDECRNKDCSSTERVYYNTNVVFDRNGKIIARYRKVNLFDEPQFSVTKEPEHVTFDTDFGVKFGTFICFDILFAEPAIRLTREHGITDIVYPTAWFSEVPFLSADQTQYGWSYAENVNLLAAGYNNAVNGSTGSGIYYGRNGIGKAIFTGDNSGQLLIAQVPKIRRNPTVNHEVQVPTNSNNVEEFPQEEKSRPMIVNPIFTHHDDITKFESVVLNLPTAQQELCQNGFCCSFKAEMSQVHSPAHYRMVVFNGIRMFGYHRGGRVQACGIVQCSNTTAESCGSIQKTSNVFNTLEISGTFHDYDNILVFPSTLNSTLLPITNWQFEEHKHDDHAHVTLSLNGPTEDILTFALYGRIFPEDPTNSASTTLAGSLIIFAIAAVFARF